MRKTDELKRLGIEYELRHENSCMWAVAKVSEDVFNEIKMTPKKYICADNEMWILLGYFNPDLEVVRYLPKEVSLGLCKGRHPLPVDDYIFPCELDPTDLHSMAKMVEDKLEGVEGLKLYVTGLTVALVEVIKYCRVNDVNLTLMHFDRDTGSYYQQIVC